MTFKALAFNPASDAIGNYQDHVRLQPGVGWQIERMVLAYDSGETRVPGDPP